MADETDTTEVENESTEETEVATTEETDEANADEKVSRDDDWQSKARKHERAAKAERKLREAAEARVKEFEDASKSDGEKLTERLTASEKTAAEATAEAARLRVALRKGLTETVAKRLVGGTDEELEADADELLASFKKDDDPATDDDDASKKRRPKERLKAGAVPDAEPDETDPAALAKRVSRDW